MKKVYLLFVAVILAACSAEPVENEGVSGVDANLEGKKLKTQQAQDPMGFYSGNSGNEKGTLAISNDCNNLYLEITPTGDAPDDVQIHLFEELPSLNGGGNFNDPVHYDLSHAENLVWTIPLSSLNTEVTLQIFAHAWSDYAGTTPHGKAEYFSFMVDLSNCNSVCAKGKGYWKNHGPKNPGNQEDAYPEGGVIIGGISYELSELQEILKTNSNTGNVFKMKQHLIVALLNIANGVDGSSINETIEEANNIIKVDGEGYSNEKIGATKDALENFSKSNACDEYDE